MNPAKCHCGRWSIQAKSEGLFSEQFFKRYSLVHEAMHQIGQGLMYRYQENKPSEALDSLPELQAACEDINRLLDEIVRK